MRARLILAGVLAMGVLLTGCQSTVPGEPQPNAGNPTEPSILTTRPSPATPPTTTAPPEPPSVATALPPQNGYVFIETKSGQTRCQISADDVGCEAPFANPPVIDGAPANGVRVTAQGRPTWIVGNLGDIPAVTLDYRTYSAEGWTIVATEDGTRFTNDRSAHGMFVSIQRVDTF